MAKILVVDDSSFQRGRVVKLLEEAGHDVMTANDGEDAWSKLKDNNGYDCVFTDLLMPNMSGQDLLAQLQDHGSSVPVVVLTANHNAKTVDHCTELGASAILKKPCPPDVILGALDDAIKKVA